MSKQLSSKAKVAVESLFRVRAAESPPGADGLREVWHQGSGGADLLSWVDSAGKVVRQELVLLEDSVRWSADAGLATGTVSQEKGAGGIQGSALVRPDKGIDRRRLERMHAALNGYFGTDRYIFHLRSCSRALWREQPTSMPPRSPISGPRTPEKQLQCRPAVRVAEPGGRSCRR